jgi:hypothetical protein
MGAVVINESVAVRTPCARVLCEKRERLAVFALYGSVNVEGVVRLLSANVPHVLMLYQLLWAVSSVKRADRKELHISAMIKLRSCSGREKSFHKRSDSFVRVHDEVAGSN